MTLVNYREIAALDVMTCIEVCSGTMGYDNYEFRKEEFEIILNWVKDNLAPNTYRLYQGKVKIDSIEDFSFHDRLPLRVYFHKQEDYNLFRLGYGKRIYD